MWWILPILIAATYVAAIVLVVRLFQERRAPSSTLAWFLALILIPEIGIPFYLLFGGRKIRKIARKKQALYSRLMAAPPEFTGAERDIEKLLTASGAPAAAACNAVEILPDGKATYERLLEMIRTAEHNICIATYILGDDPVGKNIIDLLAQKAREGVEVWLLLDAVGCLFTKRKFVDPVRAAGGRVAVFMPVFTFHKKWSGHLRNHRKIFMADFRVAMIGGRNIADEYMGPSPDPDQWEDFTAVVRGPAVLSLWKIFASDWEFATGKTPTAPKRESEISDCPGNVTAQIVASGPDAPGDLLYDAILMAVYATRDLLWICTPYFIPDEALCTALSSAARLGRDVRILVPARSDNRLADLARATYLRDLKSAGVQVREYTAGMLHSKLVVSDRHLAIAGSANIDMRSMYLNYEVSLFSYTEANVDDMAAYLEKLFEKSRPFESGRGKSRWFQRWGETALRVLAPVL